MQNKQRERTLNNIGKHKVKEFQRKILIQITETQMIMTAMA